MKFYSVLFFVLFSLFSATNAVANDPTVFVPGEEWEDRHGGEDPHRTLDPDETFPPDYDPHETLVFGAYYVVAVIAALVGLIVLLYLASLISIGGLAAAGLAWLVGGGAAANTAFAGLVALVMAGGAWSVSIPTVDGRTLAFTVTREAVCSTSTCPDIYSQYSSGSGASTSGDASRTASGY